MNACYPAQSSGNNWASAAQYSNPFAPSAPRSSVLFNSLEKQMAEFQFQTDAQLEEVRKNFILPRDGSAEAFLKDHRALPSILLDSLPALRSAFGDRAVLTFSAPLDEAGSRTAYAAVVWSGPLASAKEALAQFDEAWWIQRAPLAFGRLTFTYELV